MARYNGTTDALVARWKNKHYWLSGEKYTLAAMSSALEIEDARASQVNMRLVHGGDVDRFVENGAIKFKKRAPKAWLLKKWREHTDEQLGVRGDRPLGQHWERV